MADDLYGLSARQLRRLGLLLSDAFAPATDFVADKVGKILGRDDSLFFVHFDLSVLLVVRFSLCDPLLRSFASSTIQKLFSLLKLDAGGMLSTESVLTSVLFLLNNILSLQTIIDNLGPLATLVPFSSSLSLLVFTLATVAKLLLIAGRPNFEPDLSRLVAVAKDTFSRSSVSKTVARLQRGEDVFAESAEALRAPLQRIAAAEYMVVLKAIFVGIGVPIVGSKL